MKRAIPVVAAVVTFIATIATSRADVPYRPLEFPADHAGHMGEFEAFPELLEWWYFAGEVETLKGEQLAYNLSLFDLKMPLPDGATMTRNWALFAVSHLDRETYHFIAPTAFDRASVSISEAKMDIDFANTFVLEQLGCGHLFHLKGEGVAVDGEPLAVDLLLAPHEAPLLHSDNGGETPGIVDWIDGGKSYYYSYPDLFTGGTVTLGDERHLVRPFKSRTWFDHQWGDYFPGMPQNPAAEPHGYEWFGVRLENGIDALIAVHVTRETREVSGGFTTFRLPDGTIEYALLDETFDLGRSDYWLSPVSGNEYALSHHLEFPGIGLTMDIEALFPNQDQGGYEGGCTVDAVYQGLPVWGTAQLEIVM